MRRFWCHYHLWINGRHALIFLAELVLSHISRKLKLNHILWCGSLRVTPASAECHTLYFMFSHFKYSWFDSSSLSYLNQLEQKITEHVGIVHQIFRTKNNPSLFDLLNQCTRCSLSIWFCSYYTLWCMLFGHSTSSSVCRVPIKANIQWFSTQAC